MFVAGVVFRETGRQTMPCYTLLTYLLVWVDCRRYVATELPLRYRKLVVETSRCYFIVAGLWTGALVTFIAPLVTKPDWIYYRYNEDQKMCGLHWARRRPVADRGRRTDEGDGGSTVDGGLHWEYPSYCVITGLYIPILSGVILLFTSLRIRATLRRRRSVQFRLRNTAASRTAINDNVSPQSATSPSRWQSYDTGSRRTLKIIKYTSIAYFISWSPYVALVMIQSFVGSFKPPSAVAFTALWLANANSAVNVFIYSSTNRQFRRQCVLLVSRLCCPR